MPSKQISMISPFFFLTWLNFLPWFSAPLTCFFLILMFRWIELYKLSISPLKSTLTSCSFFSLSFSLHFFKTFKKNHPLFLLIEWSANTRGPTYIDNNLVNSYYIPPLYLFMFSRKFLTGRKAYLCHFLNEWYQNSLNFIP